MNKRKIKKLIKRIEKKAQKLELWQQIALMMISCGFVIWLLSTITS